MGEHLSQLLTSLCVCSFAGKQEENCSGSDSEQAGSKFKLRGTFEKRKTVAELFKRQHEDFSVSRHEVARKKNFIDISLIKDLLQLLLS